jgi:hypothetical protein
LHLDWRTPRPRRLVAAPGSEVALAKGVFVTGHS